MIPPVALAAFFVGVLAAITAIYVSDRRAIDSEQAFWDELRADALDGYGRVFDWQQDAPDLAP